MLESSPVGEARPDRPLRESPSPMPRSDLLSDVLAALRIDHSNLCLFDLGEPWGFETDHLPVAASWTVLEGTVWVLSRDIAPVAFYAGDTFLLPRGTKDDHFVTASSPDIAPQRIERLWREAELQGFELGALTGRRQAVRWGRAGRRTRFALCTFTFSGRDVSPLIAALPDMMSVRAADACSGFIGDILKLALGGDNEVRPGLAAFVNQTVQALLALIIRQHALSNDGGACGWLAGLGDPHIARALTCIHRQPDREWSVTSLAQVAQLSRSLFATRFLERVGQTPIRYLRNWRVHLAREALTGSQTTVAALARKLGYQSEAAFRTAFRHATGQSPRDFRRHAAAKCFPLVAEGLVELFGMRDRLEALQYSGAKEPNAPTMAR